MLQGPQLASKTVEIVCTHSANLHVPPVCIVPPCQCISRPVIQSVVQCTQNVIAGMGINPLGHAESASWTAASLSEKLGGTDKGLTDPADGEGLSDTLPLRPSSTLEATPLRFNFSHTRHTQQEVEELQKKGAVIKLSLLPEEGF